MKLTRRNVLAGAAGAMGVAAGDEWRPARATDAELTVEVAAKAPWMANGVALTSDNLLFLGLPRWPGHEITPSVAKLEPDGSVWPFPGGPWNNWQPGDDGLNAFVYVNSVHIFADDTVWCVDMGAMYYDHAKPGAQKLVQLDAKSGNILNIIRFDAVATPPGARINDLRFYGSLIYMTDSGLGALLVHDMKTGKTLRRLSGYKQVLAGPPPPLKPGEVKIKHRTPKADLIEISPDGEWLYWASPIGPFNRVQTKYLRDSSVSDEALATHVEKFFDMTLTGGSAMDTLGNLYLSDIPGKRIVVRTPSGQEAVLATDQDFFSLDAPFISKDRKLYIPCPQTQLTAMFGHPDESHRPFFTYCLQLPEEFDGIQLGNAITGVVA